MVLYGNINGLGGKYTTIIVEMAMEPKHFKITGREKEWTWRISEGLKHLDLGVKDYFLSNIVLLGCDP